MSQYLLECMTLTNKPMQENLFMYWNHILLIVTPK